MEFTPEEINLCKQVAEKHRKEIEYGDWMIIKGDPHEVPALYIGQDFPVTKRTMLPLWTISDCLEFLRGEGYLVRLVEYEHYGGVKSITCYCHGHKTKGAFSKQGNRDEEACLKAVLAVLEDSNG